MTTLWRYVESEEEHEELMNPDPEVPPPTYGTDYIVDRDGDILVPTTRERVEG